MPNSFLDAYRVARTEYSDDAWHALTTHAQSDAIYRAMRRLDAMVVRGNGGTRSGRAIG